MEFKDYPEGTKLTCKTRGEKFVTAIRQGDRWRVHGGGDESRASFYAWANGRVALNSSVATACDLVEVIEIKKIKLSECPVGTELWCKTRAGEVVKATRYPLSWMALACGRDFSTEPDGRSCTDAYTVANDDLMEVIEVIKPGHTTDAKSANPPAPLQLKDRPLEDLKAMLAEIQRVIDEKEVLPEKTFRAFVGIDGNDNNPNYSLDAEYDKEFTPPIVSKEALVRLYDVEEIHEIEVTIKGIRRIK